MINHENKTWVVCLSANRNNKKENQEQACIKKRKEKYKDFINKSLVAGKAKQKTLVYTPSISINKTLILWR